jgi:tetratricopeptide (TPR) repeat protein
VGSDRVPDSKDKTKARAKAAEMVSAAEGLVTEVLKPGRWPQQRTVDRFMKGDRLAQVLALYVRAIRLDPDEPAYPWNLSATLSRLGLNDLALAFMTTAVHVAERVGDDEWSDFDAHVALAEVALEANEPEMALLAVAQARDLAPRRNGKADLQGLLKAAKAQINDTRPPSSRTTRLLETLTV